MILECVLLSRVSFSIFITLYTTYTYLKYSLVSKILAFEESESFNFIILWLIYYSWSLTKLPYHLHWIFKPRSHLFMLLYFILWIMLASFMILWAVAYQAHVINEILVRDVIGLSASLSHIILNLQKVVLYVLFSSVEMILYKCWKPTRALPSEEWKM